MSKLFVLFLVGVLCKEIVLGESFHPKLIEFSIDLYKEIDEVKEGNFVYSSYSLANILALTSVGAKGDTASQIKTTLKLNEPDQEIKKDFKELGESFKNVQDIDVDIANKAYIADGGAIEPEFKKTAVDEFNADAENVNFNEPKKAAETINSWVEKQTHSKIKNMMDESQLSGDTRLVLVNTLYFSGKWAHPFPKYATEKRDFHNTKSDTVKVDMMTISASFEMDKDSSLGASILRMPYQNTKAELVIVIPHEIDGLESIENNVAKLWENRNFAKTHVKVTLPKFKIESQVDLKPILKKMGITKLFTAPDLSGISKESLVVTSITQKTIIDVNEDGTEAASASTLVADNRVEIQDTQVFNVDRPFMFGLMYNGVELLAGKIEKL